MIDFKKVSWAKAVKYILIGAGLLILALAIFSAGMFVGFRKARFSYQWGENYHQMFGGPRHGWLPPSEMRGDDFINPNGVVGSVIKTDTSTLYIKGNDNLESDIVVSSSTVIMKGRTAIGLKDLNADDKVVILGVPSSTGQIEAKLIRVFSK